MTARATPRPVWPARASTTTTINISPNNPPMAPVFGVHPWIVIITLLATFTLWFIPSQSVSYSVGYDAAEERLFTHEQARKACFGFILLTLAGLMLALPYWGWLGLL